MTNPWLVDSIEDFYFLKCPECNFDSKEETNFQIHAVEHHPLSFAFFGKTEVENIENMLDVSITEGDETDNFENSFGIKPEYIEDGSDYQSESHENSYNEGQSYDKGRICKRMGCEESQSFSKMLQISSMLNKMT